MANDPKTSEQLKRGIAYFVQRLKNTKSVDRIHRAHVSIRKRERLLEEAIKREAAAGGSDAGHVRNIERS